MTEPKSDRPDDATIKAAQERCAKRGDYETVGLIETLAGMYPSRIEPKSAGPDGSFNETSRDWEICRVVDAYRAPRRENDERTLSDFLEEVGWKLVPVVTASPNPAPDAMRTSPIGQADIEALTHLADSMGFGRTHDMLRRVIAASPYFSAPVPSPDGAGDLCIDCDGSGKYPSGTSCVSCAGTGRVCSGDGIKPTPSGTGAAEPTFAMLEAVLGDIVAVCKKHGKQPIETIIDFIARLATPPVRADREGLIPPVERVECVKFDDNLIEVPADPVWRVEVSGYCTDFDTETAANNFRNAILSLPVQSGAGERSQAVDVNIRRMDALIETAQAENKWEQEAAGEMRKAIMTLAFAPFNRDDVERLVLAARAVAFGDDHGGEAGIRELDSASEAFAALIPWEDEPNHDASRQPPQSSSKGGTQPPQASVEVRHE